MTKEIARILKDKLDGLPFIDAIAGLVQPVADVRYANEAETSKIVSRIPVTYDYKEGDDEYDLVPSKFKKGILYFEDGGSQQDTSPRAGTQGMPMISRVRCVCWLNKDDLKAYKYSEITAVAIKEITRRLVSGRGMNSNGITRLLVTVSSIPVQDAAIFSKYNYRTDELQYLRPPYEYFALDLVCRYRAAFTCFISDNLPS